jgi:hypothetical protein
LFGTFFIVRAERAYSQTYDEAFHVAAGMEWLAYGTYYLEPLHPPLARVATAILLYAQGERGHSYTQMESIEPDETPTTHTIGWREGNELLNWHGEYWHNLMLARLGILPFFWFAAFLIYRFMSDHFSYAHAVAAVCLFSFTPEVLANAALATTDFPCVPMYLWAVISIQNCFTKSNYRSISIAAISVGLACITKFTLIPFLVIAVFILIIGNFVSFRSLFTLLKRVIIVSVLALPVIWAGYRFSYAPILPSIWLVHHPKVQEQLAERTPKQQVLLTTAKVPAHEIFVGLGQAFKNGAGVERRPGYLLGHYYVGGKWDFFPVAILAKTQIPLLILFGLGVVLWIRSKLDVRFNDMIVLAAGLVGPLAVAIPSKINIGLRHVLPIYPFLVMFAAIGVVYLIQERAKNFRIAVFVGIFLLGWSVETCVAASPQFLTYFNEIAAPHASDILINSDLDWGQDYYKLEERLKDEPPATVYLDYFGDSRIVKHSSEHWNVMTPEMRPQGWVAISEFELHDPQHRYDWLFKYPSVEIGKSIRLYHFTSPPS